MHIVERSVNFMVITEKGNLLQGKQKQVISQHEWRAADRKPGKVFFFLLRGGAEIASRCCSQISHTVDFEGLITLHSLLERE